MRGKSVDSDFVSEFVATCVAQRKSTPKDISSEARIKISHIDAEIKRIDSLKSERSKLMDVVNSFDPETDEASDEPQTESVVTGSVEMEEFESKVCAVVDSMNAATVNDILSAVGDGARNRVFLTIKKLCEKGVIARDAKHTFIRGPRWNDTPNFDGIANAG